MKPLLLDLFCGAGGASRGYVDAGWNVIGVDKNPQPNYPYDFRQFDVFGPDVEYLIDENDFQGIHASPPCHDHSRLAAQATRNGGTGWMLEATREMLVATGLPWVIENVPGAPMRIDYRLCGCMRGLPRLQRERWFETSWGSTQMGFIHDHSERCVNVSGGGNPGQVKADWEEAMGIDWMTRDELSQAIPPAYTSYMGSLLKAWALG